MTAPASGVLRIGGEMIGVGLHGLVVFKEKQACFTLRHCADECFGFLEKCS